MNDTELKEGLLIASRYELRKYLGSGSFGEVWLATDTEMGMDLAIKLYISLDKNSQDEFKQEYRVVYGIRDEHLLTADYYGVWEHRPFLTMKYCSRGSAASMAGKVTDETVMWQFIHDVAAGLRHLHGLEPPILHQDIKPENILADEQGRFLVTDFGISRRMRSTMRKASKRSIGSGALAYMGPERFLNDPMAVKASDIWSLGVSAFELATGDLPFMGQGGGMLLGGAQLPSLDPTRWSPQLNDVIQACMAKETWERPTAEQLVEFSDLMLDGENVDWHTWFSAQAEMQNNPRRTGHNRSFVASATNSDGIKHPVETAENKKTVRGAINVPVESDTTDKPKRSSHLVTIILCIIGLLAIGAGAYFYLYNNEGNNVAEPDIDKEAIIKRYDGIATVCRTDIRNANVESYQLLIEAQSLLDSLNSYVAKYDFVDAETASNLKNSYDKKAQPIYEKYLAHAVEYASQSNISSWGIKNAILYYQIAGMIDNTPEVADGLEKLSRTYSTPIVFMAVRRALINNQGNLLLVYDGLYSKDVMGIPLSYDITTPDGQHIKGEVTFKLEHGNGKRLEISLTDEIPVGSTLELSNKSITFNPINISVD